MKKEKTDRFLAFSKSISDFTGKSWCFAGALLFILSWAILGPLYRFSDSWQLVINTITAIITFLMVFLIQNTQNRDTKILNLKLNELIKAIKEADNKSIDLDNLSNEQLKKLEEKYSGLSHPKSSDKN